MIAHLKDHVDSKAAMLNSTGAKKLTKEFYEANCLLFLHGRRVFLAEPFRLSQRLDKDYSWSILGHSLDTS